ncbi:hypothetical protein ACFCX7_18715 [Streptomyces microflavus]
MRIKTTTLIAGAALVLTLTACEGGNKAGSDKPNAARYTEPTAGATTY